MEQSLENWLFHMDMDDDKDVLELEIEGCPTEDEEFLRDILWQPAESCESESQPNDIVVQSVEGGEGTEGSSGSEYRPGKRSRPRTFILSFDNSTIIPAISQSQSHYDDEQGDLGLGARGGTRPSNSKSNSNSTPSSKKTKPKPARTQTQGQAVGKKNRSDSQTLDHIMAERKRRQEIAQRFIALSATIPGLKKTDKGYILQEAINYLKQLKERVTELEERNKRAKESMIILKKSDVCAYEDSTTSSEANSEDCCRPSETLPDVEARVMENEVLIEIHCEKEDGVELKILDHLEDLHLCVTGSSVLPFGNSTLGITIIAQMGDAYRITVKDLVKNLRQVLLNHMTINVSDSY